MLFGSNKQILILGFDHKSLISVRSSEIRSIDKRLISHRADRFKEDLFLLLLREELTIIVRMRSHDPRFRLIRLSAQQGT